MDKEKQIEEMARILCRNHCSTCLDAHCLLLIYSKDLYEQGVRKINDNEIVISKEEKQKLLKEMYEQGKFDAIADLEKEGKVVISKADAQKYFAYKIIEPQIKGCLDRERELEKQLETICKETAREILQELYTTPFEYYVNKLLRFAKKYGVEIKE